MSDLTAVILTKNNQLEISQLLKSLSWCNEIIVIDDNSIDQTRQIAKSYKAKVFKRSLNADFAAQRNFALSKAKSKWVLFIDSDEQISDSLAEEIQTTILETDKDGFYIQRVDNWLGKRLSHAEFGINLLRLGKKDKGKWTNSVHEVWNIKNTGKLKNTLLHNPHSSVAEFVSEINFYSDIHSKSKSEVNFWQTIFYPIGKFLNNYYLKLGFKESTHGFVAITLMSFHSFLAWSKAWTQKN